MARCFAALSVVLLTVVTPPAAASQPPGRAEQRGGRESVPQDPNRWKWWLNADDRKELGITDQQSVAIEQIWSEVAPRQREKWQELQRLEGELEATLKAAATDAAVVAQQVDKVEKLRANINATRTVMLYRMSQVLTADQRVKLEAHRARREASRRQADKDKQGHW